MEVLLIHICGVFKVSRRYVRDRDEIWDFRDGG